MLIVVEDVIFFIGLVVFARQEGNISSLDFHRTEDLLITASEDDSVRLYNIATAS